MSRFDILTPRRHVTTARRPRIATTTTDGRAHDDMPDPITIDVQTLIGVVAGIGIPSLGGLAWLLRALGKLSAGLDSLRATVDGFGLKLDGLNVEQERARETRATIHGTLAELDKRQSMTERDVDRWLSDARAV